MTHPIELDRPIEQALEAKARRRGLDLDAYLRDLAERDARSEAAATDTNGSTASHNGQSLTTRQQAARRGHGMLKGNGHEVDGFLTERRAEAEREMSAAQVSEAGASEADA